MKSNLQDHIMVDYLVWPHISFSAHKWFLSWYNEVQYKVSARISYEGLRGWKIRRSTIVHLVTQYGFSKYLPYIKKNPKVITVHDLCSKDGLQYLYLADAITVDSKATMKQLIDEFPEIPKEKIHLVYVTIDTTKYRPLNLKKDDKNKYIIVVGTEGQRKNVDVVIRALSLLPKNVKLIKIGPPGLSDRPALAYRSKLLKLAKDCGVDSRIIWVDNVQNCDIVNYYNLSDICVLPSFAEGFGLSALESMACGVPIIGSNRTSIPEVIGDAGLLFDPENLNELVEKISKVLNDENLRKDMIKKGVERSKVFSARKEVTKLVDIYKSLSDAQKQVLEPPSTLIQTHSNFELIKNQTKRILRKIRK